MIVKDVAGIDRVLAYSRRIAVLGIKTEEQASQAAFYVPRYLADHGVEIVPVPVYYPDITAILGKQVYRSVQAVQGPLDMVNVFRRADDIPQHVDDIIAKKPRSVWFQLGIKNDEAAERLAAAGIDVIQDRCLMVEHRRYFG